MLTEEALRGEANEKGGYREGWEYMWWLCRLPAMCLEKPWLQWSTEAGWPAEATDGYHGLQRNTVKTDIRAVSNWRKPESYLEEK